MPESIFHRESNDRYVDCGIGRFARGTIMVHILRESPYNFARYRVCSYILLTRAHPELSICRY